MTVTELARLVGAPHTGVLPHSEIARVAGFRDASRDAVVFATDDAAVELACASDAGAILARPTTRNPDSRLLLVRDPKYAFAVCARALKVEERTTNVHPSAVIHPSASIGQGTTVGAGAVVERRATVGESCRIGSRVTICEDVQVGNRVVVQPGAVLGSLGFGYVRDHESGEYLLFPQQGGLLIEDDVEIGANTTIDRGALDMTRIGRGTKIDNQVHVGHNCLIGSKVLIAAQVGISGSCVIGDGVVMAGQVGLGDHVTIGPGVILGGASGVFPHKRVEGNGEVFMGVPAVKLQDYLRSLARVRRLR